MCWWTSRMTPVRELAWTVGGRCRPTYVHGDVSVEDDVWAAAVHPAVERFGQLDCVVKTMLGILGALGLIAEIEGSVWRRTIAVLLDSVFYGTKHVAADDDRPG